MRRGKRPYGRACALLLALLLLCTLLPALPARAEEPEVRTITISAVGDCTLGRNQLMDFDHSWDYMFRYRGSRYFFQNVRSLFEQDDLTVANLEGVLSNRAEPLMRFYREKAGKTAKKSYIHMGKPEYLWALTRGGVDVVSFANNHNIDGGLQGFVDTVEACEAQGLPVAYYDTLVRCEREGLRIGVISIDLTYCSAETAEAYLRAGMADLNRDCELILACMHWGHNYEKLPNKEQIRFGHLCVDLGADLVIGCHAHILQGVERYKGRYICYSLGNFCYGGRAAPKDNDTMIVQQSFTFVGGELQLDDAFRILPCWMSSSTEINDFCPVLCSGKAAQRVIDKINARSRSLGLRFDSEGRPLVEAETDTELPEIPVAAEPLQAEKVPEILYTLLRVDRVEGSDIQLTWKKG